MSGAGASRSGRVAAAIAVSSGALIRAAPALTGTHTIDMTTNESSK